MFIVFLILVAIFAEAAGEKNCEGEEEQKVECGFELCSNQTEWSNWSKWSACDRQDCFSYNSIII